MKVRKKIMVKKTNYNVLFTADTHFGSERALELSRRPFDSVEEMDEVILKNINDTIEANNIDKLFHLGDFGNMDFAKRIKCPVILMIGNYEADEGVNIGNVQTYRDLLKEKYGFREVDFSTKIKLPGTDKYIALAHKPSQIKRIFDIPELDRTKLHRDISAGLFGHIHGRQFVKKFGIDVGVDANHFYPMTAEDVEFYLNAIAKGYYDEEVFC